MMTDHCNQRRLLTWLLTMEARWTLGVYLAPDGNNQLQEQILLQKNQEWAENTWCAHLDCTMAWLNITMTLIWQIFYVLLATTCTQNQCNCIMQPCLGDRLAVAGYTRSFPGAIIHAPYKYFGLNLTDMYSEQGVQHILAALQFGHSSNDLTGKLIWGSLELLMLEVGMPENPFHLDYNKFNQLATNSWVKMLWQFQNFHKIWIEMDLQQAQPSRLHDWFLIASFIGVNISRTKLAHINHCRLYLQVTTLSDIFNGSGQYILPDIWAGKQNQTFTSGYHWPNQGWPPKKDWTLWQLALWQAFPVNNLLHLDQPLGLWTQSPQQSTHQWHWLTSYATQKLYHWTGLWQIHDKHCGYLHWHPKYQAMASGETDNLPPDCKQVTIKTTTMYLTPSIGYRHQLAHAQTLPPGRNSRTYSHWNKNGYFNT